MGRHAVKNGPSAEFEDYHPGCMWSMLHVLVSHHWHTVKGIPLLRRKHGRKKHALCCRKPETVSFNHFDDEFQEYLAAEAVPLLVEEPVTKTGATNRTSGKARVEAVIGEEISAMSRLHRTISIHHFEPSELGGKSNDRANIIILHTSDDPAASKLQVPSVPKTFDDTMNAEGYLKQNQQHQAVPSNKCNTLMNNSIDEDLPNAKKLSRELSCRQFKECADVMEIYKVNKNLFLEMLQNPNVQVENSFQAQQAFNAKARLKKSGSFPAPGSLHTRFDRLSTLEHKQREIWSFPKGEKLPTIPRALKLAASETLEDSLVKRTDPGKEAVVTQETSSSSLALSQGHNKRGWHISFMSHFKDVKKKIKHALREVKKEKNHTSVDALFQRVPSRCHLAVDEKEMSEELMESGCQDDTDNPGISHEINYSGHEISKDTLPHVRRVSSLNESVDKYVRLFECSFSREGKWHQYHSRSLRLTSEDKFATNGPGIKSFKRRLSLPDFESFCPLPNEAASIAFSSEMPMMTVTNVDTNVKTDSRNDLKPASSPAETKEFKPLEDIEEIELETIMIEKGSSGEKNEHSGGQIIDAHEGVSITGEVHEHIELVEPEKEENNPHRDWETGSTIDFSIRHEEETAISVLKTRVPDDASCPTDVQVLEGFELDSRGICIDEPDTSNSLQDRSNRDSLPGICSTSNCENIEKVNSLVDNQFLHFALKRQDDADFNYVRNVLDISGFMEPECLGTWHSLDQPLSPTLFKELEAYLHHDVEYFLENIGCCCDHRLLFDLINEQLLQIYESSLAYFPKPFSFTQHVRPVPKGNCLLEEVWKRIRWYERSRSKKMDQSVDDLVAQDFAKGDGWMNIYLDVEDVALDLEDIIFDELLDEIVCS